MTSKQLDVRFQGKTIRMTVTSEVGSAMICIDLTTGLKVTCYPSGRADVEKRDPRTNIHLYEGLGSWHLPVGDTPSQLMVRIKRKTMILDADTGRQRELSESIEVPATRDYEELAYRFTRDSRTWLVPLDKAEEL